MRVRCAVALAIVASSLLLAAVADAKTTPLPGAVAFPDGVALKLPFGAGHPVRIHAGYGPNMGSTLHTNTDVTGYANDHYALDLVYDQEPSSGKGLPIVAALPGTVVRAGWATAGWANYGLRVILRHDLGDGHVYHSIYCHLDAIDPSIVEGAVVGQAAVLGTLGQSCQGMQSCSSFSTPHLHWALHRDSTIGGTGTGGSYGGNAVVPEPLDGAEDLIQGRVITSTNGGIVPPCATIPPAGRVVDDNEIGCFSAFGTPSFWHVESGGYGGSLSWTTATDDSMPDNYGAWALDFAQAGSFVVEVYTDAAFAESQAAAYQVTHASVSEVVVIDQAAADGWQSLGSFSFDAGGSQLVRLDDNTGEPVAQMRRLVFDAIRLSGESSASGGGSSGAGGGAPSSGAGDALPDDAVADGGCACRIDGRRGARARGGSLLLLALALLHARRSRHAPRPRPRTSKMSSP